MAAKMSENLLGRNGMTGSFADAKRADNIALNAKTGQALVANPNALAFADPITLRAEADTDTTLSARELDTLTPNDLVFAIRSASGDIR